MVYERIVSAIYNDIVAGLTGYTSTLKISLELLYDDVVDERLSVIKQALVKGIIPRKDLLNEINCITVDCTNLERCCVTDSSCKEPIAHFEIPLLVNDFGEDAIEYLGSTDRQVLFVIYTTVTSWNNRKYRRRGHNKPCVYIDFAPNKNNKLDCFIFNCPLIEQVSISAIFKDPRQLEDYGCCNMEDIDNFSFLNSLIKQNVTEKKIRYYRQLATPVMLNDQIPQ